MSSEKESSIISSIESDVPDTVEVNTTDSASDSTSDSKDIKLEKINESEDGPKSEDDPDPVNKNKDTVKSSVASTSDPENNSTSEVKPKKKSWFKRFFK